MKRLLLKAFKGMMNIFYKFFKCFKTKNKVTFISRQSDEITLDFKLLGDELWKDQQEAVFLTKKLEPKLARVISYFFHMFRQMYHIATSKVVVVDSYCILVSILKHKEDLKVIQTWHALSAIKKFGYQTIGRPDGTSALVAEEMNMHANYDFILAASDKTALDFCKAFNTAGSKIVKLGLPRIDYILREPDTVEEEIRLCYPQLEVRKNIIYIPTFRKGHKVDVEGLVNAIDFEKYNLIVKIHPLDKLTSRESSKEQLIFDEKYNSYDWLRLADVVISDYSSFVIEATLGNKPLFLYGYDEELYKANTGLNIDYSKETIGKYLFKEPERLAMEIEKEYDFDATRDLGKKYIDVDTRNCSRQIVDFIETQMGDIDD